MDRKHNYKYNYNPLYKADELTNKDKILNALLTGAIIIGIPLFIALVLSLIPNSGF